MVSYHSEMRAAEEKYNAAKDAAAREYAEAMADANHPGDWAAAGLEYAWENTKATGEYVKDWVGALKGN